MIAADTNLMVRILVDDPGQPGQVAIVRKLASETKQLFVPQVVAVELVWAHQFQNFTCINSVSLSFAACLPTRKIIHQIKRADDPDYPMSRHSTEPLFHRRIFNRKE